jgi:hypothetical protein
MKLKKTCSAGAVAAVALLLTSTSTALADDPATEAKILLNFCLAHPEACSISVDYAANGAQWHVDYNGTRLNVLASNIKVVHLITYADAVDRHQIDPSQPVPLNTWAQFWVGRDGGALASAYAANVAGFSPPPQTVTNDQIVSGMIRFSDNAAPDYLLNKLGAGAFQNVIQQYIAGGPNRVGYVDLPQSINAAFTSWWGNPAAPLSGIAAIADYSGYASDEYRSGLDQLFTNMHNPNYVSAIRQNEGVALPWVSGPLPTPGPFPLNELQYEQLTKGFFMRSNTRTYNQFMLGLLRRNLLTPGAQAVVEKYLEYDLTLTSTPPLLPGPLSTIMKRYGTKGGDFATVGGATILTKTTYEETLSGTEVVVSVQLNGTPGTATDLGSLSGPLGSLDSGVTYFPIAMATDPAFATLVHTSLGAAADPLAPSLIARVAENTSTAQRVQLKVNITNIGSAPTRQSLTIGLFGTNNSAVRGVEATQQSFPPLQPGATVQVDLSASIPNTYFVLVIDPNNVIPASQKQDNPQFELTPGH